MSKKKWLLVVIPGLLLGIQLIPIDKTNPEMDPSLDYIAITRPPSEVESILRTACYDCHSYYTYYPWYSDIAPVSWWLKNHVNEGREHFNLSTMGLLPKKDLAHAMEEAIEVLKEKEMPLWSYTVVHKDARLSDADRALLTQWFQRTAE